MAYSIKTIEWSDDGVVMIDQTKLPTQEVYNTYKKVEEVAQAIKDLVIRGAPAIGVAAAMGIALGVKNLKSKHSLKQEFERICKIIHDTRPTAQNLFWAIKRMRKVYRGHREQSLEEIQAALRDESIQVLEEDIDNNRRMGEHGQQLLKEKGNVLTHCNAGALATGGYGTALGVIRSAVEHGRTLRVFIDETRPFLQGSRLTAWEMMKENIPCTLITDNMAGHFMQQGQVQAVIVGTDRTVANGDVANKIGTYSVAVLAHAHQIPFYVAAPTSTIDLSIPTGEDILLEERSAAEVTLIGNRQMAPDGIDVAYPAFDVTPHHLVRAIITEEGVARAPYIKSLAEMVDRAKARRAGT